jgi:hypothetical protein
VRGLPVYGVGHSTGALLTLLINSRYSAQCDGNVLLSYNNRPAIEVIPFLAPFIAPGAKAVGPFLSQAASNPFSMSAASLYDTAKTLAPSLIKMGLPALEQLSPVFMDVVWPCSKDKFTNVASAESFCTGSHQDIFTGSCCNLSSDYCEPLQAHGRQEFSPSPKEIANLIDSYYSSPRTMLIRFADDDLDKSSQLLSMLQQDGSTKDLTLHSLRGNHSAPLVQNWVDLPQPIAHLASSTIRTSGTVLSSLSSVASDVGLVEIEGSLKKAGRQVSQFAFCWKLRLDAIRNEGDVATTDTTL